MMYGTRKTLNTQLKRAFGNEEPFALLIWTREQIENIALAEGYGVVTDSEVEHILKTIGDMGLYDHTAKGISWHTVGVMLRRLRIEQRTLEVPVDLLARLTDIAASALSHGDDQAWPLVCQQYPSADEAQADIAWLRQQLAA